MIKEELTKLLMEAYERGQSDIIKSCQETVSIAVDTAILAEREACAKIADYKLDNKGLTAPDSPKEWWNHACKNISDAIRSRGKA